METRRLETLKQIAAGVAAQFGSNCEVVIHDVSGNRPDHTIVHIENGHVSGRKVGDGASQVVLDQLARQDEQPKDHLCYLTRTPDGKILKSSSLYIRNSRGGVVAIFSINYDVSGLMMIQNTIGELLSTRDKEHVPANVSIPLLLEFNNTSTISSSYIVISNVASKTGLYFLIFSIKRRQMLSTEKESTPILLFIPFPKSNPFFILIPFSCIKPTSTS